MSARLIKASEVDRQFVPGTGTFGFLSNHLETTNNVFADLVYAPGDGLGFHIHPKQEEFVYLTAGTLEVWLERNKITMNAGDTLFVPAGVVHASFNVSDSPATVVVVLTPPIPSEALKFELVDVSAEEPWASLR